MTKTIINNPREIILGDTTYRWDQNISVSFRFDSDNLNLKIVKIVLILVG